MGPALGGKKNKQERTWEPPRCRPLKEGRERLRHQPALQAALGWRPETGNSLNSPTTLSRSLPHRACAPAHQLCLPDVPLARPLGANTLTSLGLSEGDLPVEREEDIKGVESKAQAPILVLNTGLI